MGCRKKKKNRNDSVALSRVKKKKLTRFLITFSTGCNTSDFEDRSWSATVKEKVNGFARIASQGEKKEWLGMQFASGRSKQRASRYAGNIYDVRVGRVDVRCNEKWLWEEGCSRTLGDVFVKYIPSRVPSIFTFPFHRFYLSFILLIASPFRLCYI